MVRFAPMRCAAAIALLLGGVASAAEGPEQSARILVLSEYELGSPSTIAFISGLQAACDAARGFQISEEYFDATATGWELLAERDRLRGRYFRERPDVVVALGPDVLAFVSDRAAAPWPGVPVVFGVHDRRLQPDRPVPAGVAGVTDHFAIRETVDLALRLLPATRHVAVVGGASPLDRSVADLARAEVAPFAPRLDVVDLVGLPTPALIERLRTLPDHAIVLLVSYLRDGAGQRWTTHAVASRIAAAARGPLFSVHASLLGTGIVGGVLGDFEVSGRKVGEVVRRVLAGEPPGAIPLRDSGGQRAILDGRQLERWGIPDARVPGGVEIRFKERTAWSRYGWAVLAALVALGCESLLITGLLVERRRRRIAERRSREDLAMVAHLNRVSAIGEMAGAYAHELNSPLGAVVNNAQAARRFMAMGPARADEVAACLGDIVDDARRAGEVIRRMRGLMKREDTAPAPVDVAAVVRDAVRLVELDARNRGVELSMEVAPGLPELLGDDVQLVQVVLNLVVNAVDAVGEVEGERWVRVTAAPHAGGVEIQVADSGPGIGPAQAARIFEPFFTTKASGLGLGLCITRSIVEAHGGTITLDAEGGRGTTFHVRLPAPPARHAAEALR